MNTEYEGRQPTDQEVEAIDTIFEGYTPPIIRVYDNYISDGPGYVGWLAITVGGEPQFCNTFFKDRENKIVLCAHEANFSEVSA